MALIYDKTILLSKIIEKTLQLQLKNNSSFYIFKKQQITELQTLPNTSLPINRFVNPMSLMKPVPYFSLWSLCHLQSVQYLKQQHPSLKNDSNYIIKNPWKDQDLIKKSFDLGIRHHVVDSFEQLYKLHTIRSKHVSLSQLSNKVQENPKLQFIWDMNGQESLKKLENLINYNIKVSGLLFKKQGIQKQNIEGIVKMVIEMGHKINCLLVETTRQQYLSDHSFYNSNDYFRKQSIKPILQIADYSQVQDYVIMAKASGINKAKELIVKQQVYQYLTQEDIQNSPIIQIKGKKWIVGKVKKFPCYVTVNQQNTKGVFDYLV